MSEQHGNADDVYVVQSDGRLLLTDEGKNDLAVVLGTWTLDLSLPEDETRRWGHLSEVSAAMVANCVQAWLHTRTGRQSGSSSVGGEA